MSTDAFNELAQYASENSAGLVRIFVDILIVAYLVYRALLFIRGTRAAPMLFGLSLVVLLYLLSQRLGLVTLAWVLNSFFSSLLLLIVVLFQDEIRRGLTKVGLNPFLRSSRGLASARAVDDVAAVAGRLAHVRLGALIVIQREVGLEEFTEGAAIIDAAIDRKLIYTIFLKDSPLHDGAIIIEKDKLKAAGCLLPLSTNPELDPQLGTRHRAALGLSEQSDAVIVVVSEELGAITLVHERILERNLTERELRDRLLTVLNVKRPQLGQEEHAESRP